MAHGGPAPHRRPRPARTFYTGSTPIATDNRRPPGDRPASRRFGTAVQAAFPYSLGLGSQARNAINVPLNDAPDGTTVVGAPQLTFTYSGVGTSRHVYAQIVDKKTGLVVGNIVTPIPVTLDGHTHEANFSMEDIVYTYGRHACPRAPISNCRSSARLRRI